MQVNREIRFREVRLIDENGTMVGIVPIEEAQRRADDAGLDLVLISPRPDNPVCRIMDYGRYQFEQSKRAREARRNQKVVEVKEVGFRLTTEEHDLQFKLRHASRFLGEGNRVKISIRFRGREMAYQSQGYELMEEIAERLSEVGEIDRRPMMEGRFMTMFLAPIRSDSGGKKGSGGKKDSGGKKGSDDEKSSGDEKGSDDE
ncbi:MAG: translation initiation factor IF-3 [Clostridiaceae bacterium]|nr:translation initiation factor IF-3 [Clostridiaceae bacterium]